MKLKKYRLDLLVIALLLLIALASLLIITLTKKEGNVVVLEIDGAVSAKFPLSVDGVFPLNGGTNTLVIENGEARLINSHCPDHTCEQTGAIRYVGQTIVCLPNRLSLTVKGEQTEGGVELIS